jgi:hypothetical protein
LFLHGSRLKWNKLVKQNFAPTGAAHCEPSQLLKSVSKPVLIDILTSNLTPTQELKNKVLTRQLVDRSAKVCSFGGKVLPNSL